MNVRFTSTRSRYIVKYFFFFVSIFDLLYTYVHIVHNWIARQSKAIKNLRNCSSNQTTNHRFNLFTDNNNAFVNPSYTLIQWLFFCSNFRHGRDRMWSYVDLSPPYGYVNERLETLRMKTGDHRTDRERTSYPRNHPAPDCVSVSMHFRVFRGHRN